MLAGTKAIICEAYDLFTEENLTRVFNLGRMDVSRKVYETMELREITLRLRLGLPLDEWQRKQIDDAEDLIDHILVASNLRAREYRSDPKITGTLEEREARYKALMKRLEDALRWTKWGRKLEKDAEREYRETKRSAYIALTGDTFWYRD